MPRTKAYDKEQVLEKAMNVFWNHGYGTTSVRLLEKEMGINQFSIYSSFSNKKNLFIEALRKYREQVAQTRFRSLLEPGARIGDLKDFLNGFVEAVRRGETGNGCLVVNTTSEMIGSTDPDVSVELQNYFAFVRGMMGDILLNSLEAGDIPADTDIEKCSNYLLGVMQGLSVIAKSMNEKQVSDYISVAMRNLEPGFARMNN
ncbi:MAG: TetR/AcrR family transcriptional regulator [Marinilabilia sp.]